MENKRKCRLCGFEPDFECSKYIFDKATNLAQIINKILPITVSQDDHFKHICLNCYNKLISYYDFIQSVLEYNSFICSKESGTKIMSFFEVNKNERLENIVISKLHSDMIYACPNCNKDLILFLKSNPEDSNYAFDISLAVVDQIEKSVEETNQISEDITDFVNVCTQKSNIKNELSLNNDIINKNMTNDKQDINGIHKSSQNDNNHTNPYITLKNTDGSCESNKGTKKKFQESVSIKTSIKPTKLQKLEARLDVMEQDVNKLNSDNARANVTGLITFQSINKSMECLSEKNKKENTIKYTIKKKHFDKNLTKLKTEIKLNTKDELSSNYDRSSTSGLITFQPENNDIEYLKNENIECLNDDIEIKENDSMTDMTIIKKECINEGNANNIPKSNLKHVCNLRNKIFIRKEILNKHQREHSSYKKIVNIGTHNNLTQKTITKQKRRCTICRKLIRDVDPNAVNDTRCASCRDIGDYRIVDGKVKMISHRQYHCLKCRKHFLRRERLEFHEMRHNENMDEFICSTCGKEFSGENSLYEHYLFVHKGARPHICEICGQSFQLKTRLKEHHRKHTGEKPYQCEICTQRCMTTHALKFHKKSHFPIRHSCEICGKSFIKKQNLNEHLEKHWKKDKNVSLSQIFTCPVCNCDLPTYRMLKYHLIGIHQIDRHDPLMIKQKPLYECNKCEEKFKHQMSLKAHKERVHEGKAVLSRVFQCDICKTEYKGKQLLINHIKGCEGRYKCTQCNMTFADIKTLYRHVSLHTCSKLFICEYCNMDFKEKDARDAHRRKHTNSRPYQCTDCNKSFDSYTSRSNHRKKIHGDNETECPECKEKCGDMQEIRIHLNTHLGEKLIKLEST